MIGRAAKKPPNLSFLLAASDINTIRSDVRKYLKSKYDISIRSSLRAKFYLLPKGVTDIYSGNTNQ
ncbi:hypothetical protein LEP1GSC050_3031 [Leptospira broomii serovar Hurstbridge str. 5399]|uniref:Uncharacterized protein n=1 Tax=Leptospira broomii serovar Hurstbridge str. 5399 TaxID=1049789 RepID=T0FBW4_9LEPT|nr:hypothetical protein LEP1GSC050_3031 [Leptospira broomii serovar Hurstbridge str. 5399]